VWYLLASSLLLLIIFLNNIWTFHLGGFLVSRKPRSWEICGCLVAWKIRERAWINQRACEIWPFESSKFSMTFFPAALCFWFFFFFFILSCLYWRFGYGAGSIIIYLLAPFRVTKLGFMKSSTLMITIVKPNLTCWLAMKLDSGIFENTIIIIF
jgi:hypothetical protein